MPKPESPHLPAGVIVRCFSTQIITTVASRYWFILTQGCFWPQDHVSDWAIFYLVAIDVMKVNSQTNPAETAGERYLSLIWGFGLWYPDLQHTRTCTENTGVSLLEECPMLSIRPSVPVHSACILEFGAQRFPWDERYLHVGYNKTSFRTHSNYLLPLCQFSRRYKAIWLSLLLSALVVPLHKSVCNHISVLSFSRSLKAALILSALYFIL